MGNKDTDEKFDIVVIGGGPAGLIASGRAAQCGAKVLLLEKNPVLGKKLLLTGNGRCNLTNIGENSAGFIRKIGKNGRFLFSALSQFGPEKTVDFFQENGVPTKSEKNGRVFPMSDRAADVRGALERYVKQNGVVVRTGAEVSGFVMSKGLIRQIKIGKETISAGKVVLCVGGKSYPGTGSTGDGFFWAKKFGHNVKDPTPALVPVRIKEDWIKNFQGVSLPAGKIQILLDNKKKQTISGGIIFTHFGLSGPAIINASRTVGQLLEKGALKLSVDLLPQMESVQLAERLKLDFQKNPKKELKNYLPELLSEKLSRAVIGISGIDPKKKLNFVTKEEKRILVDNIKNLHLTVSGLMDFSQAMVTSGGVTLSEVDSKTMRSKIVPNLFFAGEILDLDGPTGGYNLQIAWSTGFVAGSFAADAKG